MRAVLRGAPGRRAGRRRPRRRRAATRARSRRCAPRWRPTAPAAGDVRAAFGANRDFHLALVAGAGNPFLRRFVEGLWARRVGLRIYEAQRESPDLIALDADQHEAIADAVARGAADEAERLTREHIGVAMRVLLEALGDDAAA